MKQSTKNILEFGPLIIFFLVYKWQGLINATAVLVVVTAVAVIINYVLEKKVPVMPLASAVILGIFGILTVISEDTFFIKIKPTIVNLLFAAILLIGAAMKKGMLKYLMGSAIEMNDKAWLKFSIRWGFFFIFLALVNEVVWRSFEEDFWVKFKVFGMLPLTMLFVASQIPFLKKNIKL